MTGLRQLTGVALVIIGALFLIVAYLVGWTSSNIVLITGLIIILIGIAVQLNMV